MSCIIPSKGVPLFKKKMEGRFEVRHENPPHINVRPKAHEDPTLLVIIKGITLLYPFEAPKSMVILAHADKNVVPKHQRR